MKTYIKTFLMTALLGGAAGGAFAQDPHLSQYYSSPLFLNPALTGMFNGEYRISGNQKTQWGSITNPYSTSVASFDALLSNKLGVGGYVLHQSAGDGGYKNTNIFASASYYVNFGQNGDGYLVFGLQGGLVNKTFDQNGLYFSEQYRPGMGYDPGLPSGENFADNNALYADFNAGVFVFDGNPLKTVNPFAGYSVFHLLRPKESLFSSEYQLPMRHLLHAGARFRASESVDITPHALFMRQVEAQEVATGVYGEYHFPYNNNHLLFGATYRWDDAVVPYVGFQISNILIGVSYDVNTSGLNPASFHRGGFEFSLSFIKPGESNVPLFFCPRL